MTTAFLGGQPTSLTIPLVDANGLPIMAVSVAYRLLDQSETELIAKTAVADFTEGNTEVVIAVSGAMNALTPPNTRELRLIELYCATSEGVVKIERTYLVEAEQVLVESVNSFQPYPAAVIVGMTIPNLPNWNAASKEDRIAAMIRARQNIGMLRFRYVFDAYQNIIDNTMGVNDLTLATPAQWNAMPTYFKDAVRRAQVIEADYLLMPDDSVAALRREGLMSMTVGEAKQFFRPVKSIEGPVCKRAMKELTKWVLSRHRIGRT